MAENSNIEWTHHTFNPWIGCTKISAACDHCYAEAWDKRGLHGFDPRWGPHAARTRTSASTWAKPLKWQKAAKVSGERKRVFCASLADAFDNHKSIQPEWRNDLWALIRECPDLDWLMLTKRPQNIVRFLPTDWDGGYQNVWLGATVENQTAANRLEALTKAPAAVRFLSMEPLLGRVNLGAFIDEIDWVITGGENGKDFRPVDPDWFRYLRDQCAEAAVPLLFKQWEGATRKVITAKGRELDGIVHDGYSSHAGSVVLL